MTLRTMASEFNVYRPSVRSVITHTHTQLAEVESAHFVFRSVRDEEKRLDAYEGLVETVDGEPAFQNTNSRDEPRQPDPDRRVSRNPACFSGIQRYQYRYTA